MEFRPTAAGDLTSGMLYIITKPLCPGKSCGSPKQWHGGRNRSIGSGIRIGMGHAGREGGDRVKIELIINVKRILSKAINLTRVSRVVVISKDWTIADLIDILPQLIIHLERKGGGKRCVTPPGHLARRCCPEKIRIRIVGSRGVEDFIISSAYIDGHGLNGKRGGERQQGSSNKSEDVDAR